VFQTEGDNTLSWSGSRHRTTLSLWWPEAYGGSASCSDVTRLLLEIAKAFVLGTCRGLCVLDACRGLCVLEVCWDLCSGARVFGARVMPSLLEAWWDFCLFLLLSFLVDFLPSLRHRIQKGCGEAWQSMGMVKLPGHVLLTSEHFFWIFWSRLIETSGLKY